jgi:RimJ/RimL family protein N-acetyltransferase
VRFFASPDGTQVLIRPIRATDKALLARGLSLLSPASIHARFLSPKPRFSSAELSYLTEVDGLDHVALVAVDAREPTHLIGVARFVRDCEHPDAAEAAVVLGDLWQGMGLGRTLGLALAEEARARGIRRFTATMLPSNTPALRLFRRISDHLESQVHDGVRELVAELYAAA